MAHIAHNGLSSIICRRAYVVPFTLSSRICSGFPYSGTGFWRMEPIKIRISLVILSLEKQRFISSFLRSEQRSNKNERPSIFLMFLRIVCNACVHSGNIQHSTEYSHGPATCSTTSRITGPFLIYSIDIGLNAIARSNIACFAACGIDAGRMML